MMHMWFWLGTDLGSFLFPGYDISSSWGLFSTCLGLLSLAVVYEAMKVLQIKLHKQTVSSLASDDSRNSENSSLLAQIAHGAAGTSTGNWKKWATWNAEILHWITHTILGYMLMLSVMTYNGYIAIALIIGAGIGYWIFGPTLIELNLAHYKRAHDRITRCDAQCADAVEENAERRSSTVSIVAEQLAAEVESVTAVQSVAEIHAPIDV